MEENLTKRRANNIIVTLYSATAGESHELAQKLSEHIDADGNDAREFVFEAADFSSPYKETDIAFINFNEKDSDISGLKSLLEKKQQGYIVTHGLENAREVLSYLEKLLDMGFTVNDFTELVKHGINIETLRAQLLIISHGIPKIALEKPAVLNDGIFPLSQAEAKECAAFFDAKKESLILKKFVPASGAATRMFKFLTEFMANYNPENESINAYINKRKSGSMKVFLVGMEKFPFYEEILGKLKQNPMYEDWIRDQRHYNFIKLMLSSNAFDFASKPKAILPFHHYDDFTATPVYEHLRESVAYAASKNNTFVHFTISEEHLDGFLDNIKDVKEDIEKESGVKININFSNQHKSTDTIAVDMNNMPFRDSNGSLLFRPGGHGALIENLNNLKADIVFVKNIDNVGRNNLETVTLFKKALAGILIKLQEKIFDYLKKIDKGTFTEEEIKEIFTFAAEELFIDIPEDVSKYTPANKIEYLAKILNRPIRVCGMVRNEGEPGGGPFWVKSAKGKLSLQIVESSQMDLSNKLQEEICSKSTHFNPVDLVCGLKNYKGEYFDLTKFVDSNTGFIVHKHRFGKEIKSYELPGLWNGAMAKWITIFVEVPLDTFNPVKNVNDLLKPAHQPQ